MYNTSGLSLHTKLGKLVNEAAKQSLAERQKTTCHLNNQGKIRVICSYYKSGSFYRGI